MSDTCPTCGRHTDTAEEPGEYYCYDCSRYIKPASCSPLEAELDELILSTMDPDGERTRDERIVEEIATAEGLS